MSDTSYAWIMRPVRSLPLQLTLLLSNLSWWVLTSGRSSWDPGIVKPSDLLHHDCLRLMQEGCTSGALRKAANAQEPNNIFNLLIRRLVACHGSNDPDDTGQLHPPVDRSRVPGIEFDSTCSCQSVSPDSVCWTKSFYSESQAYGKPHWSPP